MIANDPVVDDPRKHTIAIVGAGASGYRFFAECIKLLERHKLIDTVKIVMIDRRDFGEFGRGVAWSSDQSHLLRANMHTSTIVFDPDDQKKLPRLFELDKEPKLTDGILFDRRQRIGDALAAAFQESWSEAAQIGVERHAFQDNALRIVRSGVGYQVECESGRSIFANTIVLALGHFPSTKFPHLYGTPGYVWNVWKWDELDNLDPGKSVALVGLGPTAVDALLLLRAKGFGSVFGYSRSGMMQYPRPRPIKQDRKILTEERLREVSLITNGLRFDGVIALIAAEFFESRIHWKGMKDAFVNSCLQPEFSLRRGLLKSNTKSSWFGMLKAIDDVVPEIWRLMPPAEKNKYLKARRVHTNVSYGMASPQALSVLNYIENRQFIVTGGLENCTYNEAEKCFEISVRGQPVQKFSYLIDCSGIGTDIDYSRWPLIENMKRDRWLYKHPYGGTYCDFVTGKLLNEKMKPVGDIYSIVGSLTYGTRLLTNCINEVANSAKRTADAVVTGLAHGMGSVR